MVIISPRIPRNPAGVPRPGLRTAVIGIVIQSNRNDRDGPGDKLRRVTAQELRSLHVIELPGKTCAQPLSKELFMRRGCDRRDSHESEAEALRLFLDMGRQRGFVRWR